jgi:hypothetical protein
MRGLVVAGCASVAAPSGEQVLAACRGRGSTSACAEVFLAVSFKLSTGHDGK